METEFLVSKIRDGTVIDHIPANHATKVFYVLDLPDKKDNTIAVLMNAKSAKLGKKDVVKIEGRRLDGSEMELLALIAPDATVNVIEDYKVTGKTKATLPDELRGVLMCSNTMCITNNDVEARSAFSVVSKAPISLECLYCHTHLDENGVVAQVSEMATR